MQAAVSPIRALLPEHLERLPAAGADLARLAEQVEVELREAMLVDRAHIYAIARRVGLTRYRSPGWPMALDITRRLRRLDPRDPVKYDFAFHRMGLWKREAEIASLRRR